MLVLIMDEERRMRGEGVMDREGDWRVERDW